MTDHSVAAALSTDSTRQLEHFALMADLAGVDLFVSDTASDLFITCNASARSLRLGSKSSRRAEPNRCIRRTWCRRQAAAMASSWGWGRECPMGSMVLRL